MLLEKLSAGTELLKLNLQLFACRAEALLKLHRLQDAELSLSNARKSESSTVGSQSKIFGMLSEAYILFVQSQMELALGR